MAWGIAAGLVLAAVALTTKAIQHKPLLSPALTWAFVTAVVVAPLFEEFMFRGAVLGVLAARYRFTVANLLTAALFLGMHLPGWYFQGRLFRLLLSPVGGALSVLLIGMVFGYVRQRSGSVVAGLLAHAFNNFFA
jgi:membrane protease YdiL (CAAX protease family)